MQQYGLLDANSLYDSQEGTVPFKSMSRVHSLHCGHLEQFSATNKNLSVECVRLRDRVRKCCDAFDLARQQQTLTLRREIMMHTPGMRVAVAEEMAIIRKERDELKAQELELDKEWKQECWNNWKSFLIAQSERTFLVTFIDDQITHSQASGAKQRRYDPTTIHFWKGFRHQPSGRACIEYLTGAGNYGKTKDNNSNTNFNLHVPSNRTLDEYEEPGYYPMPTSDKIQQLKERAEQYAKQAGSPPFILTFDSVFVIPTYQYDMHGKRVLGGERVYTREEFLKASDEDLLLNHGREVVQFFLQHVDGGYVEAVGHWVMPHGKSEMWIADRLKQLITVYSSSLIKIIGSSSDGDLFSLEVELVMKAWNKQHYNLPWYHFPDYCHATRNARNALKRRTLMLPGTFCIINMKRLLALRKTQPLLNDSVLPAKAYNPDEMNMNECLDMFNMDVVKVLDTINEQENKKNNNKDTDDGVAAKAFSSYFSKMRTFYDLMRSSIPLAEKLPKFGEILTFLQQWQSTTPANKALAPPTFRAITLTITNLHLLDAEFKARNWQCAIKTSVLSTQVVELHFSIARGILSTFTVLQYCHINTRVSYELLQRKSPDARLFTLPSDNRHRTDTVYNDVNIKLAKAPLLEKVKPRAPDERKQDQITRMKIQEITAKLHADKEPAKVRGILYNHRQFRYIECPNSSCSSLYSTEAKLVTHLAMHHKVIFLNTYFRKNNK